MAIAALPALVLIYMAIRSRTLMPLVGAAMWLCLAAGLGFQAFSPNLPVDTNGKGAFIFTPEQAAAEPASITVKREKNMKALSALFVVIGAVGLFLYYKPLFMKPAAAPTSAPEAPQA
ncbi:MAG: hypothetical protein QOJ65_259 [Fimbriimonadaceae bacterium]|nr:hypothetical protein [Fimbriimonadaceae bacterium]